MSPLKHRPNRSVLAIVLTFAVPWGCSDDNAGDPEAGDTTATASGGSTAAATSTTASDTTRGTGEESTAGSSRTATTGDTDSTSGGESTEASGDTGPSSSSTTSETESTGTTPIEDVDLNRYQAVTEVLSIPAPLGNASGVAWNYDTDRLWVVQNGSARFYEYAADDLSVVLRMIRLVGINASDTEGLTYLGGGEVGVAFEGGYGVYIADVPVGDSDIDVPVKQTLTLAPPPPVGNNGLEGIAYDTDAEVFFAVGEGQDNAAPRRFFRFERPTSTTTDFTWQDTELTVTEPFNADDALPGNGGSLDLAGAAFDSRDGSVLIISHTGSAVIQVDPLGDGEILGQLDLPQNQWEGVVLVGPNADLVIIGESNDAQRYVYGPPV